MINITNKKARQLYLQEMTRTMMILENIQARQLKPVLNKQYLNAASLVQQGVLDAIDHVVSQERQRLITLLSKSYRRVATTFSNKAYKVIEDSKKFIIVPDIKGPKDEFWTELNGWMRTEAATKVTGMQKTSRKLIAKTIQKGMGEGLSNYDIAKNLRKTGKLSTPIRARTIAITETHTVAVKSVDSAIKSTRIEMDREWVANIDKRTRPAHVNADGQKVAQDGMFIVDGIPMAYPGDPKGGPNNSVRCRCVLMYHAVKRMDKLKTYKPHDPSAHPMNSVGDLSKCVLEKIPKVPVWQKTGGGKLFKDKKDALTYNKHFERYSKEKLTRKRMRGIINKEMKEMRSVLRDWKEGTNLWDPVTMKVLAQKIERKNLKSFAFGVGDDKFIEKILKDKKFRDRYLRIRALQQAKFKQDGITKLTVYRGTDGDGTGPKMRKVVMDLKKSAKKAGRNWRKEKITYEENSLVGYSAEKKRADKFGRLAKRGGVTVSRTIDVEDAFFELDETYDYWTYAKEKEVIILGGKKELDLGIFSWKE